MANKKKKKKTKTIRVAVRTNDEKQQQKKRTARYCDRQDKNNYNYIMCNNDNNFTNNLHNLQINDIIINN
jgi:hypothetical protein